MAQEIMKSQQAASAGAIGGDYSDANSGNSCNNNNACVDEEELICLVCYDSFVDDEGGRGENATEEGTTGKQEGGEGTRNSDDLEAGGSSLSPGSLASSAFPLPPPCPPNRWLKLRSCDHSFCRTCLKEYCQQSISVRRVPIPCPSLGSSSTCCGEFLHSDDVRDALFAGGAEDIDSSSGHQQVTAPTEKSGLVETSAAITTATSSTDKQQAAVDWRKFDRLHRLFEDPSLVACPRCEEPVSPDTNTTLCGSDGDAGNRRRCCSCLHEFCARHGDGHPGMSCAEHRASEQNRQLLETELALRKWTQPCSHCGIAIFKVNISHRIESSIVPS